MKTVLLAILLLVTISPAMKADGGGPNGTNCGNKQICKP